MICAAAMCSLFESVLYNVYVSAVESYLKSSYTWFVWTMENLESGGFEMSKKLYELVTGRNQDPSAITHIKSPRECTDCASRVNLFTLTSDRLIIVMFSVLLHNVFEVMAMTR